MEATLSSWIGINDTGGPGRAHGGMIMRMCDEAAGLAAIKHSSGQVVTGGVDRLSFLQPVFVGELVTFSARINAAWTTSMEVGVKVTAENPVTGETRHVLSAYFSMVAVDDDGRPRPVEPVEPTDDEARRRESAAQIRREGRLAERERLVDWGSGTHPVVRPA